jgi:hypothetical protein
MRTILVIFLLLAAPLARAVVIPVGLTRSDREEVIRMLGLATSTKLLSNPFPLGGYSGFEVGLSMELINIRELAKLGCTPGALGCNNTGEGDKELRFSRLVVGKGLYNNVDVFMHFAPQNAGSEITSFGGAARYAVAEARFLPVNLSLVLSADHVNVNDQFQGLTLGAEAVAGIFVNNFSLYLGVGQLHSTGTFIGGSGPDATVDINEVNGVTNTVEETVDQVHTLAGLTIHLEQAFLAAQIDRYPDPAYSVRLGLRF